jgi:hypothetical protein
VGDDVDDEEQISERPERRPARRRDRDEDDADERLVRRRSRFHDDENEDEDDRPRRPRSRKKRGNPALLWGLIGGGVLLVAGGAILLILLLTNGKDDSGAKDGARDLARDGNKGAPNGWAADPVLVNQLAPETAVENFRMRPPKGYTLVRHKIGAERVFLWTETGRPDLMGAALVINFGPLKPGEANKTLAEIFEARKAEISQGLQNLSFSSKELGQINGLAFLKIQFSGTYAGKRIRGLIFLGKEGQDLIALVIMDTEAQYPNTVKLWEAAALTFRKP